VGKSKYLFEKKKKIFRFRLDNVGNWCIFLLSSKTDDVAGEGSLLYIGVENRVVRGLEW